MEHILAKVQTTEPCQHEASQTVQIPLHEAGLVFAPLVSNSLGQLSPDLHRFFGALLTMLRATRSRLSFKIFPIWTLIPHLQPKQLSNVCEV